MKFRNRFIRLASALAVTGFIASQLPGRTPVSLAADGGCQTSGSNTLVSGAGGLVIIGAVLNATGVAGGGAVGSSSGGLPAGAGVLLSVPQTLAGIPATSDFSAIYANSGQQVAVEKDLGLPGVHQHTIGAAEASVAQEARTVFAPTNESLNMVLGAERVAKLKQPSYQAQARALVASLTFQGRYTISRVKDLAARGQSLLMFSGDSMTPNIGWGELMLSEHPATDGMVIITNGVFNQN